MEKPVENLAPSGNREALDRAVAAGADAVYLGCASFSARAGAGNFDEEGLREAVAFAHLHHVRVHVTVNTLIKDGEMAEALETVRMVRAAGAKEVHLRSASPPIMWPDYYGIDMPDREHLLAANKSVDEIAKLLEVDSMGYLSVDGLYWAMEAGARDPANPQFTDHYFTGDYPTRLLDREIAEGRNDGVGRQLSFLVDA